MRHCNEHNADSVVVLDFETTGLSPDGGDRAIEIGAVRIEQGRIGESFQSLMNPGRPVSGFIESYTGISNAMLRKAPPCEEVMHGFADFIGDRDLVAHNASFDRRFLDAECRLTGRVYGGSFACSMLAARRLFPRAPNHKLATLVTYKRLPTDGTYHRALADARMTAHLWLVMLDEVRGTHGVGTIPFTLMRELGRVKRGGLDGFFKKWRG